MLVIMQSTNAHFGMLQCARDLCVLHARACAVTDPYSPFMAVKDKYRRASEYAASMVAPLAGLPEALCVNSASGPAVLRA